jgi:D-alanyl-D-alanine carboxypeptidase
MTLPQRIADLAARRGAPGAQYVALRHGQVWHEHVHGLADAASARPVTSDTTFNAYSITKPFTAAAVLALAQSGRLDLDAPAGAAAGVEGLDRFGTLRETLLHRAGFPNPNPLKWVHPADAHAGFDEDAFVRERMRALQGARRGWARSGYSNLGYLVLGLAVARAWGGPFVQAVRALALDPLRLQPGEQLDFVIPQIPQHARGHLRRHGWLDWMLGLLVDRASIVQHAGERWVTLRHHHVDGSAFGGLMANARGLARFGQAILDTGDAMAPEVRRSMLQAVPGPGPSRSLALPCGTLAGHRWLAHAGGGLGAYGELRIYPDLGIVSAILTNGPGFTDARCLDAIDIAWIQAATG